MKKNILLFLTGLLLSLNAHSQSVGITDFMRLNPYANLGNPAHFIPYNGYVGIPGASNINFSLYNTGFHYKNLVVTDKNWNPIGFTPNKFVKSLHPTRNWLNTNLDLEILGLGFRIQKYFFSVGYRLKVEERFRYNQDLFGFIVQGNLAQDNNGNLLYAPAKLAVEPNLNIYQEMSIGFQGQIFDWLYVGARPKILFGLVNIKTDKLGAEIYTDPDDYTISGNYDVNINVASIIPFYKKDADGKITLDTEALFNIGNNVPELVNSFFSKNTGFAIDLGAVYRINQRIRVSAAITDLGFIRWKGTPLNIASDSKNSFKFSGFAADPIAEFIEVDDFSAYFAKLFSLDSIFSIVNNNFEFTESEAYTTALTSKIMLDGYFDLTPSNRFILQFKGYIMGKHFLPQFTMAYNGSFFNVFDIVVSYSMMRKSFANLGLGLGIRVGPVHLYAGTDNILALANILNATRANVTTGLLINFPVKRVKEPELKYLSLSRKKEKMQKQEAEASE